MNNILKTTILLAAFSLTAFVSKAQSGIQFHQGTFQEALNKATKENKLVFMDAYTAWCGPCRAMSANTFTNPDVADYFNQNFVNIKVDMEKGEGPTLSRKFAVTAYPTLLFLNGQGSVVHKELGFKDAATFLSLGKKANGMKPAATTK
jgi:thiol:disulfide interchange protein